MVAVQFQKKTPLAMWVFRQRKQYQLQQKRKKHRLTKERINLLNSINFDWGPGRDSRLSENPRGEQRFRELCQFKKEHGHCNVPKRYSKNPSLGNWVKKQRDIMKNHVMSGEPMSPMIKKRFDSLTKLGFVWNIHGTKWDCRIQELLEYKNKNGNCLVPCGYPENPSLGKWVAVQRCLYKLYQHGKKSSITQDKIDKLNKIGFEWKVKSNVNKEKVVSAEEMEVSEEEEEEMEEEEEEMEEEEDVAIVSDEEE
eukprot:CCRYP_003291-RA/>CCRYP_003291-RA protein AED:0.07 eAED:0.07 QI:252/1/1/1/0.83/0.71/7/0/252